MRNIGRHLCELVAHVHAGIVRLVRLAPAFDERRGSGGVLKL